MNTQQRIDKITVSLRDIYQNTNEGSRLIAEMVKREFPLSVERLDRSDEVGDLKQEIEDLKQEIEDLSDLE